MRNRIKNYFLAACDFFDSYLSDIWRYWRHSQAFARFQTRAKARFYLFMSVHALEKGLALQERRPGFGKAKCRELMADAIRFQGLFGSDPVCAYVRDVVEAVLDYHAATGHSDEALVSSFHSFKNIVIQPAVLFEERGGLRAIRKQEVMATLPNNPFGFFASRYSVRQFSNAKISEASIREAVRMAQRAPSVCNRQSCRVYYATEPDVIAKVLRLQNGAAGFGENAAAVFVITSELGAFNRAGERNQAYVDGGIFAQTFALGMHALGFGTCCLNWSKSAREDRKLRRVINIPVSEVVIALFVAGCLRDEFVVAASPRRPTDEILCRLQKTQCQGGDF